MKLKIVSIIAGIIIFSATANALTPIAEEGKKHFAICNACHDPNLDPPKAAPMFGVQKRYKRAYVSKEEVIMQIVYFVKNPGTDKALMRNAVKHLGLMPPLEIPDELLFPIANYIYEESFAPPCKHWEIAIKRLGKQPDQKAHLLKDQRMYERFCR